MFKKERQSDSDKWETQIRINNITGDAIKALLEEIEDIDSIIKNQRESILKLENDIKQMQKLINKSEES